MINYKIMWQNFAGPTKLIRYGGMDIAMATATAAVPTIVWKTKINISGNLPGACLHLENKKILLHSWNLPYIVDH